MIYFRKIRFKNFQSYGNVFTEIELDKYKLSAISGKNGSGKTSISSALFFCLYGKTHTGVNKPKLVNAINKKNLLVEVEFETNGNRYMVRRGIKPNIFEIYKNDKLIPQPANVSDYQDDLENRILKIGMKNFTQMVVLGSVSFVPFMELSAGDRRIIIENLLDISIFSTMKELLAEKMTEQEKDIQKNQYDYREIVQKIRAEKIIIDTITQKNSADIVKIEGEIKDKNDQIVANDTAIQTLTEQLRKFDGIEDKKKDIENKIKEVLGKVESLKTIVSRANKDTKFLQNNEICPMCHQDISDEYKANLEATLLKDKTEAEEKIAKIREVSSKLMEAQEKLITALEQKSSINQSISKNYSINALLTKEVNHLKRKIEEFNSKEETESHKTSIIEYAAIAKELLIKRNSLMADHDIMTNTATLLKDGGIKSAIIDKFIPLINKMVNYYLSEMDFFLSFELDKTFKETIKARYRDEFTYQNLSQGEKRRLDMALLFTWRYIANLKNSNATNLLFIDEILDSSLDEAGIESLLKILGSISNTNVFVITHREALDMTAFDNVLQVTKRGEFSCLS